MRNLGYHTMRTSLVTALYDDAARSFRLEAGATFSDLAERLARIGRTPLSVDVKFDVKYDA